MEKKLSEDFKKRFKVKPEVVASAPGRINIIGEHTDYNMGFVLPAAIDRRIYFLASSRVDGKIVIRAENFKEEDSFNLPISGKSKTKKWSNYIRGVLWVLNKRGKKIPGLNILIYGEVPLEAGLSSSAALEVSCIIGLNSLYHIGFSPKEIAKIGQKAENDFVGVKCGLMDQFISVFGRKNSAVFLDCLTLEHKIIPFELKSQGLRMLIYNTRVKRKLASSEYNKRRSEANSALDELRKSGFQSFRDISVVEIEKRKKNLEENLFKRAKHVVSENYRVKKAVEALSNNDFIQLGKLLFFSHESLRDDYQVSCPELDLLYECGRQVPACLGARMTGAGFGGSGIALVREEVKNSFKDLLLKEAAKKGFVKPEFYDVEIGEGARSVQY